MSSPLLEGRTEFFRYDLLDKDLNLVQEGLDVLPGGSLEFSSYAEIGGSGSVPWIKDRELAWYNHHLRVYYVGAGYVRPLITAAVYAPEEEASLYTQLNLSLLDTTTVLAEDTFGGSYSVPAGTVVTTRVAEIIEGTGWAHHAIPASAAVLPSALVWEPNTTKLRIVNDLLAAINYWGVWSDPLGRLRSAPYVAPDQRPVVDAFKDGPEGNYLPGWRRVQDTYKIPNRVVCVQKVEGEEIPVVAESLLDDLAPSSPFTIANRGRTITRTYTDVDAVAGALQAIADRRLLEAQQVTEKVEFAHAWLPGVELNTVVTFNHRTLAAPLRGVVQAQTVQLQLPGLFTTTVRGLL